MRRFFAELETRGAGVLLAKDLACTKDEEAALRAEGIVSNASLADRWECGEIGCARVVVKSDDGFTAVCARESDFCETLTLRKEDLAQIRVSLDALLAVVRRELRVDPPRTPPNGDPRLLGEQGAASPRDVFFAPRPRSPGFAAFLALREHAPRATLVIVPVLGSLDSDVLVRHAAGAKVEIDALADALHVRGGRIRAAPRLRAARPPPEAVAIDARAPKGNATLVPHARRWPDLTILAIDERTILVKVGWRRQRLTFLDLGLAAKATRKPTKPWIMLLAVCAGRGEWQWNPFGTFEAAKSCISRLREAMCTHFGVEENPFHDFTYEQGWRAKFLAGMWTPDDEEDDASPAKAWDSGEAEGPTAESAWAVAFDDWKGKSFSGKAKRPPPED